MQLTYTVFFLQVTRNTFQEDIVARVFGRHGLRLDVEFSHGKVGTEKKYPYIKAESLVKTLERYGKLHALLGFGKEYDTLQKCGPLLAKFWSQYQQLHGTHQVFESGLNLHHCVPCYLHGDEGTTYKKDGCLVLSIHTPLGYGTVSQKLGPIRERGGDARTNFAGHALTTRFMLAALLRVPCQHGCF